MFHAFLGERLGDWHAAAKLVKKIAENYKLPYYTLSPTYSICKNHGYLAGEQYECPVCHEKTEVYSRITGYYRPVQNWNDGKAQEYKQRKNYQVSAAPGPLCNAPAAAPGRQEREPREAPVGENVLLFTTASCPNCRAAKEMLQRAGVLYTVVPAEEQPELVQRYDILQAPTLVLEGEKPAGIYPGLSGVQRVIELFTESR